jgi:hypothetical protein
VHVSEGLDEDVGGVGPWRVGHPGRPGVEVACVHVVLV